MLKPATKPSSTKPSPKLPDEIAQLLKETTSRLRHLDVQGWYEELTRIYKLSVDHDLWLADVLPGMFIWSPVGKPGEATETTIGYIAGPTAKFVVNVNMPDANIHAEFKQWLEEVRKQIMPPVAKPGQYALNSEFDTRKFGTWQSEGIIQFADLLAWRATLGPLEAKRYPDWLLGRWLKRETPKNVSVTKATLKKALASLPALGAQVEHEMAMGPAARKLIAARIAKDIAR